MRLYFKYSRIYWISFRTFSNYCYNLIVPFIFFIFHLHTSSSTLWTPSSHSLLSCCTRSMTTTSLTDFWFSLQTHYHCNHLLSIAIRSIPRLPYNHFVNSFSSALCSRNPSDCRKPFNFHALYEFLFSFLLHSESLRNLKCIGYWFFYYIMTMKTHFQI